MQNSENEAARRPGLLIVISGPSGTGKGTICQELLQRQPQFVYSISATTRLPRPGEIHGVNYFFVSPQEFRRMVDAQEMLEWAKVYGNYYGTPRCFVESQLQKGRDVILEIDTQGASQIKDRCPQGIFIFVVPPSLAELSRRIVKRGTDSAAAISRRLASARDELSCAANYDYVVVNDDLHTAVETIQAIIIAEKCRIARNLHLIQTIKNGQ